MTTSSSCPASIGRPREFQVSVALRAALAVFWRQGYTATSLNDLTTAMGLSRSSFYGAFGSKHEVLLLAIGAYVDDRFAELEELTAGKDPVHALRAAVAALAKPGDDDEGCLLVNSICELAPGDVKLCELADKQIARVLALLEQLLASVGHAPGRVSQLAGALLACAMGITTMRKAGLPDETITLFLRQAERLLDKPG